MAEPVMDNPEAQATARQAVAWSNVRAMRLVDRLAERFNAAGVGLMLLKGAALQLRLYDRPDQRAMGDVDLMVRPGQLGQAMAVLVEAGAVRSQHLVREDFFPRFYYEAEFTTGTLWPVVIDLHIRPFRPLRYTRLVPDGALWERAEPVDVGRGRVFVPGPEDMLLHLAVHYAIHGGGQNKWAEDIGRWLKRYAGRMDWGGLLERAERWRLVWPLRRGLEMAVQAGQVGRALPQPVMEALAAMRVNWRDRLALAQAPHDNARPWRHVAVEALTTPGLGYVARYLWSALVPDRRHMRQWYGREHRLWLAAAHLLRWSGPLGRWWRGPGKSAA